MSRKRRRWILPVIAVVGVAGVAATAGASARACTPGVWKDPDAPRRIREIADRISAVTGWANLSTFLVAKAYWESRGNFRAVGDGGAAFGAWQMHAGSRCFDEAGITPIAMLGDEELQVAIAACHAYVLGKYWSASGQHVTLEDLANGWKAPALVKTGQRNENFREALCKIGEPESFADRPGMPQHWPGFSAVLAAARGETT